MLYFTFDALVSNLISKHSVFYLFNKLWLFIFSTLLWDTACLLMRCLKKKRHGCVVQLCLRETEQMSLHGILCTPNWNPTCKYFVFKLSYVQKIGWLAQVKAVDSYLCCIYKCLCDITLRQAYAQILTQHVTSSS